MEERRPIPARDAAVSHVIARRLARAGIRPNTISVASVVFAGLAGLAFWSTRGTEIPDAVGFVVGAVLVVLRLLANMFDGMVAVEFDRRSPLGGLFNEVPDRIADVLILLGFGAAVGSSMDAAYVASVVAVFVAYVRAQLCVSGAPQDFVGPMAKPHRMFAVIAASLVAAVLGASVQSLIEVRGESLGLPALTLLLISALGLVTAARRLVRGSRAIVAASDS